MNKKLGNSVIDEAVQRMCSNHLIKNKYYQQGAHDLGKIILTVVEEQELAARIDDLEPEDTEFEKFKRNHEKGESEIRKIKDDALKLVSKQGREIEQLKAKREEFVKTINPKIDITQEQAEERIREIQSLKKENQLLKQEHDLLAEHNAEFISRIVNNHERLDVMLAENQALKVENESMYQRVQHHDIETIISRIDKKTKDDFVERCFGPNDLNLKHYMKSGWEQACVTFSHNLRTYLLNHGITSPVDMRKVLEEYAIWFSDCDEQTGEEYAKESVEAFLETKIIVLPNRKTLVDTKGESIVGQPRYLAAVCPECGEFLTRETFEVDNNNRFEIATTEETMAVFEEEINDCIPVGSNSMRERMGDVLAHTKDRIKTINTLEQPITTGLDRGQVEELLSKCLRNIPGFDENSYHGGMHQLLTRFSRDIDNALEESSSADDLAAALKTLVEKDDTCRFVEVQGQLIRIQNFCGDMIVSVTTPIEKADEDQRIEGHAYTGEKRDEEQSLRDYEHWVRSRHEPGTGEIISVEKTVRDYLKANK